MVVQLKLKQLELTPGQRIVLRDVDWQQFEDILEELGDRRGSRLAYFKGTLEIVAPLGNFRFWIGNFSLYGTDWGAAKGTL